MKLNYEEAYPEKQYYAIGEVATMLNTTVSKIRFWEIEFDVVRPKKNKKGDRFFTKQDIEYLRLIYHLLKEPYQSVWPDTGLPGRTDQQARGKGMFFQAFGDQGLG
jgi:hypothetical protein